MPRIFLGLPHYRAISDEETKRLKKVLALNGWKTRFPGLHPIVDISLCRFIDTYPNSTIVILTGDGDLARIRSVLMGIWKKMWDEGRKHDYFLTFDDDLEFDPKGLQVLIDDDKPVISGLYTYRSKKVKLAGIPTAKFFDGELGDLSGPFKIRWAAGGFILIKSEVLHHLIEHYNYLKCTMPEKYQGKYKINEYWTIWDQHIFELDGYKLRLSEDYAFCQRLREVGYDIWADWRPKIYHWDGEMGYGLTPIEPILKEREELCH